MTMEVLSNFVSQNYFWILIIGIILIMALIGFIADKKNLVKIKLKKTETKDEKDESIDALQNMQDKSLADIVNDSSKAVLANENVLETSNVPSPDVTAVGTDGIPAELFAPMEDSATSSNDVNASENHEDIVNTIQEQPSPEVDTSQSVGEENVTDVPNVINGMEIVDFDLDNKDEVNTIEQSMSDNVEAEPSIDSTALANENEVAENIDVQPNEEVSSDQSNVENADIQPNIENTPEQPSLENTDVQPETEQEPAIDVELPDLNSEVDQAEEDVWKF